MHQVQEKNGPRDLRPHLRKKKRTPSLASPHLGLPNPERAAKSRGFQEDNLAAGDGPKVPRAVERTPFTLQPQRDRITAEEIERAIRLKREPDPVAKFTAVDRMLEDHEWIALAFYIQAHYRRESGRPAMLRYDDTPRGLIEVNDLVEQRWRTDLEDLEFIDKRLPLAHQDLLDLLTWQMFPNFREGIPPSKVDIGRMIIRMQGRERAEGGYEGYLRCLAQLISEAKSDAAIDRQRRKRRREAEVSKERKRLAETNFR